MNNHDNIGHPSTAKNVMEPVGEALAGGAVEFTAVKVFQGAKALLAAGKADDAIKVFRVFGGDAKAAGFSWTTENPNSVFNFRDAAGLPSGGASGSTNTGQFVIEGTVKSSSILKTRSALPLDGNAGGLRELIIDPKNVNIKRVSGANPNF
jgi:hypothetical protein